MTDAAATALSQRLQGRYRIERLLGRGGMGAVYLARDVRLDRLVAVKELPAELADDAVLRERFLREVRLAAGFSHPNIVAVYAVEEQDHALAFVMSFVEGESLTDRIRRTGPMTVRDAVRLLQDIAYALAYAHGRGVVHRDLKPDNIMIERATGRALLMDFGVARPIGDAPAAHDGMTRVGEVVGTPEYMSPEQATGDAVDGRSDLYALGLTAFFALTGEIAFGGESVQRILVRQLTEAPPSLAARRPDLPDTLCAIVDRCIAKDRNDRFASAEALIEALEAAQVAAPDVALPVRLFATELETLGIIGLFMMLSSLVIGSTVASRASTLDAALPVTLLASVFLGRVLQTRAEATRLRHDGFTPSSIRDGIAMVLAEREARRAQLRATPEIVARRRRTMRMGVLQLVIGPVLIWGALQTRRQIGPSTYQTSLPGVFMLFSGLVCLGMGLVLLARSPFRGGVPERILRVLAFRLPSRWIIGRDDAAPSEVRRVVTAPVRVASVAVNAPVTSPELSRTLAAIDARLARIEAGLVAESDAQRNSQPLR